MKTSAYQTRRVGAIAAAAMAATFVLVLALPREKPAKAAVREPERNPPVSASPVVAPPSSPTLAPTAVEPPVDSAAKAPMRPAPAKEPVRTDEPVSDADTATALIQRLKARRTMLWYYGAYLQQSKLDPENLTRLKDLLTREMETPAIVNDSLRAVQVDQDSSAGAQAVLDELADTQQEVRRLLGEQEYVKMGDMARAVRFNDAIENELQPNLYGAAKPLSETQSAALAQRFAEFTRADNGAFQAALQQPPDPTTGLTQLDLQLLQVAQEILQPEQLEIMRNSLQAKRTVERQKKGRRSGLGLYKFDL